MLSNFQLHSSFIDAIVTYYAKLRHFSHTFFFTSMGNFQFYLGPCLFFLKSNLVPCLVHVYFFLKSNIAMLIFGVEKINRFYFYQRKRVYFMFESQISPKDTEKHNFGQILQLNMVNYAYFQVGNNLAMLILWKNLSLPCLFFSILSQPC